MSVLTRDCSGRARLIEAVLGRLLRVGHLGLFDVYQLIVISLVLSKALRVLVIVELARGESYPLEVRGTFLICTLTELVELRSCHQVGQGLIFGELDHFVGLLSYVLLAAFLKAIRLQEVRLRLC